MQYGRAKGGRVGPWMNDRVRFGGERALVLMRLRAWKNRIRDVCRAGEMAEDNK